MILLRSLKNSALRGKKYFKSPPPHKAMEGEGEEKMEEKLLVFASGEANPESGGSGFVELVENSRSGILQARIVAVVSNHKDGGVAQKAKKLGIEFVHFPPPYTAESYQQIWQSFGQPPVSLSGWIKKVVGLPVHVGHNIHPAPLPGFGGQSWYGHSVHERVMEAFKAGQITSSAVCMHFVTQIFDDPNALFFKYPVLIRPDDDADSLGKRVNKIEHGWQSFITNLVITRQIRFQEGAVVVPPWYKKMSFCPDNCQVSPGN